MPPEQSAPSGDAPGYTVTVHLTEDGDGWRVTVSRTGEAAAFVAAQPDAAVALALAKTLAGLEGADLEVLTTPGRGAGYEFVPAARVASYVLPIRPPPGAGDA